MADYEKHTSSIARIILFAHSPVWNNKTDAQAGTRCTNELAQLTRWSLTKTQLQAPVATLAEAQLKLSLKVIEFRASNCTPWEIDGLAQTFAIKLHDTERWPDHIAPMPRILGFHGDDCHRLGQSTISLKYHLRGVLNFEVRHDSEFVGVFRGVTRRMEMFIDYYRSLDILAQVKLGSEGVPMVQYMITVHQGYVHELGRICVSLFGPDIAYFKVIVDEKRRAFRVKDRHTLPFDVELFKGAQDVVLKWALVRLERKIILTDISN
jgi:hypothetical protein